MTNIKAMKLALDALGRLHFAATELDRRNRVRWFDQAVDEAKETIAALRQAISEAEQAKQEPVLTYYIYDICTNKTNHEFFYEEFKWHKKELCGVLGEVVKLDLYTAPPQREWVCEHCGENNAD